LAGAIGLADGRTSQLARADQVRHGPVQAPRSSDVLACSAMDQVVRRWALLERGMVQSILGVAGEATNRRYSPLIAAAHIT
jgi:hypothetical protein